MSAVTIAGVLVVVFLLGVLLSQWKRESATRLYNRIEWWRKAIGALVAIILVATFIQSGNPALIGLALVLALLAALWFAVEQPHKEVV